MLYKNIQDFNDGIRLKGQTPLDDRLVAESISDLYITTSSYASHDLYNRAYRGMTVTVVNTNDIYICFDASPYTPDTVVNVNANNFKDYWKRISLLADDSGTMPTIKILNDVITGGKYKITKLSNVATGIYASYKLQYAKPGDSTYNDIVGSIQLDIPEVEVVEEVHVCKAYMDDLGVWHETSRQGDPNWDTDTNEVYLHILWDVKDPSSTAGDGKETYINVGDMIDQVTQKLEKEIADLSTNTSNKIADLSTNTNNKISDLSTNLNNKISDLSTNTSNKISDLSTYVHTKVDTSISDVSTRLKNLTTTTSDLSTYVRTKVDTSISDVSSRLKSLTDTTSDLSTYVRVIQKNYIDDLSTNVNNSISDLSTNVNTTITNKINDLSTNVNTTIANEINQVNEHLSTLDSSADYLLQKIYETELTFAAATQVINTSVNRIDTSVQYLWENRTFAASPMAATRSGAKSASIDTIDTPAVAMELSELFAYNENDQVNIDMRELANADSLYITKNNVDVPVFKTFREDSENIVYYYDFIDSVGFRRSMVEIGMDDNSNLVVITNKIITLCKIR